MTDCHFLKVLEQSDTCHLFQRCKGTGREIPVCPFHKRIVGYLQKSSVIHTHFNLSSCVEVKRSQSFNFLSLTLFFFIVLGWAMVIHNR